MKVEFSLSSDCQVYFADTCTINTDKADAPYWLRYKSVTNSGTPLVIPTEEINSWGAKMDEEGCFYGLFYNSKNGTRKLTFTTDAPEETDPVYPTTTIAVVCDNGKQPYVQVSEAQTLTIKDEAGNIVKTVPDAQPETKYPLSELPAGKYTLEGENEKIVLNL